MDEELQKGWLAATQYFDAKHGGLPLVDEPANTLILGLLLHPIVIKDLHQIHELPDKEREDALKTHSGVRTTFLATKILHAGWSSTQVENDTGAGAGKRKGFGGGKGGGDGGGGGGNAQQKRERFATLQHLKDDIQGVFLHSYELMNIKGSYTRGSRSEEFVMLEPGMVLGGKIFGNKVLSVFKDEINRGTTELGVFQMALIQVGLKNISSKSAQSGLLMEVKSIVGLPKVSLNGMLCQMDTNIISSSLEGYNQKREAFLSGERAVKEEDDEVPANLHMEYIANNLVNNMQIIDTGFINEKSGIFAVTADNKVKFHVSQNISDITAKGFNIVVDPRNFGTSCTEWIAKFLNVATLLNSVKLIAIIDQYRLKNIQPMDQVIDAYAVVDSRKMVAALMQAKYSGPLITSEESAILDSFQTQGMGTTAKHCMLFSAVGTDLDIVIDTRKAMKKAPAPIDNDDDDEDEKRPTVETTIFSSLAHPDSAWGKGRVMHIFFQKSPVLTCVIRVPEEGLCSIGNGLKFRPVELQAFASTNNTLTYDEDDLISFEPATTAATTSSSQPSTHATDHEGKDGKRRKK